MRSIVIGTAGHIDHGKSALVRALTGVDPDRLKEERERGITIDLGFANVQIGGINIAFVDVPGHERFVKNMLAGAGGIDAVLLVVAADESVMPQTREHFQICRLLHVTAGAIVLTKTDLVDAETLDLAAMEVRELVEGSFLAGAPVVPVSSKTGDGLEQLRSTLVSIAGAVPARRSDGAVRLPIDRVFSMKGFGTVVTGTLVSGHIAEEQDLVVLPEPHEVKVRGLQVHGRRQPDVGSGNRVAVNLGGVDVSDLVRGETLCEPGAYEPSRRVDVVLELLPGVRPLRHGGRVRFHNGTTELLGRVAIGDAGARIYARIHLESPAVVTRGDRFIIRAYSPLETIGGGVVLDPQPPRSAIRTAAGLARFARLDVEPKADQIDRALVTLVEERSGAGLSRAALVSRLGLSATAAREATKRAVDARTAIEIGDLLVSPRTVTELSDRLVGELKAHHTASPLSDGMPREEARERIFRRAAPAVFEHVLERLVALRRIVARERLAIEGHQVSLSPDEARIQSALERIYREAHLTPPDLSAAAGEAGAPTATAERMAALLLRNRTLVKIESLMFHAAALETLKADVRALKQEGGTARVDVAAFKERYGVTRKFAIPLLEYLDRERVTRRMGDARIVL